MNKKFDFGKRQKVKDDLQGSSSLWHITGTLSLQQCLLPSIF